MSPLLISSRLSMAKPYLLLDAEFKKNNLSFNLFNPTETQEVKNLKIQHQSQLLRNIFQEEYVKMGSSRAYLALALPKRKDSVYLVNLSNQATPKVISLPPLSFEGKHLNVSVSSPHNNGDITVAVKYFGSRLSLWGVGESEWSIIDLPTSCFDTSPVMYSEIDKRFYLHCNGYSGSIDLAPKSGLVPVNAHFTFPIRNRAKFEKDFPNFPIMKEEDSLYISNFCSRDLKKDFLSLNNFPDLSVQDQLSVQEQLVESPCGKSFMVYRFGGPSKEKEKIIDWKKTQNIVVVEQDKEQQIGTYTDDIGDLSIFIGQNEAFCVSGKEYPGIKPNSVYFATNDSDFGVCDLSSRRVVHFSDNLVSHPYYLMVWIAPPKV